MAIEYRLAKSKDLPRVAEVFAAAIDDLTRKHGFFDGPTPTKPISPQYAFWLKKNPNAFWVAEEGNEVVGYTFSFLRGSLWFLADLFVLPEHQGKGIGGALIRKTLNSWRARKIGNFSLITPAFNRASVSLYMRFGMLPRQPVYFASAPRRAVAKSLHASARSEIEADEVTSKRGLVQNLDKIHKEAQGFPAGWHNEFFSEVLRARCLLFKKDGRPIGYAFFRDNGRIGPLVVKSASHFAPAFEATLRSAVGTGADELEIFFPGTNEQAVKASIRHGFRITSPLLFLSSKPMGDWNNYMFYSPGLM